MTKIWCDYTNHNGKRSWREIETMSTPYLTLYPPVLPGSDLNIPRFDRVCVSVVMVDRDRQDRTLCLEHIHGFLCQEVKPIGRKGYGLDPLGRLRKANAERQVEWQAGQELGSLFRANELAGEIAEAMEAFARALLFANTVKKLEREKHGIVGSRATLDQLGEELADGIICFDLLAQMFPALGDLWPLVVAKFNKTSAKNGLKTRLEL